MKKLFTIFCIVICLNVSANTINVPAQYSTIQAGINSSNNGDTILVANGTYYETNITFGGKEVVLLSENGPLLTIIDGSNSGGIFDCNSGETFNTEINGFTIQNDQANEGSAIGHRLPACIGCRRNQRVRRRPRSPIENTHCAC